jgi:hypothetical protein
MFPEDDEIDQLGPPEIALVGLQIWGHGRQFPDAQDYWDGNWLRVTTHCGGQGASVWASGPIIHLSELLGWYDEINRMNETISGKARLCRNYEPNLFVKLTMNTMGHLSVEVDITPDHLTQKHSFHFNLDQTYLPRLLAQCKSVLDEYPIRGQQSVRA